MKIMRLELEQSLEAKSPKKKRLMLKKTLKIVEKFPPERGLALDFFFKTVFQVFSKFLSRN